MSKSKLSTFRKGNRVSQSVPPAVSSFIRPGDFPSPSGASIVDDIEMHAMDPRDNNPRDTRHATEHWKEDPHFIADYLARNTSKAAAVFRRYDRLAIYRLLVLSRELASLEQKHDICVYEHGGAGHVHQLGDSDFDFEVGSKVKEYYDLLIAYSQVLHLEPPAKRTIEAIDKFVSSPESHNSREWWGYRLKYELKSGGDEKTLPDLVSLYTPAENDYLSRFIDKFFYGFFLTPESNKHAKYVNERKMQRFVTFLGTIISIGFLVAAMWVLWRLNDDMIAKLATVTGFVVAFAAWLGFLTTAQRKDVIAATAAYAAVLVVFVSQQT